MNLKNNKYNDKLHDPYAKVSNAEEMYEASVVNQKVVKNFAFLALGVAGIGVTTAASMLLGKGGTNIVPTVTNLVPLLIGTVGIGGMSSVMALTTASFMGDTIVHAESEVKNAYAAIPPDQKGNLLSNKKGLSTTISNLREKHLKADIAGENKLAV